MNKPPIENFGLRSRSSIVRSFRGQIPRSWSRKKRPTDLSSPKTGKKWLLYLNHQNMKESFSTLSGYTVAEVEIDEQTIRGVGGSSYPRLQIFCRLDLKMPTGPNPSACLFTGLSAHLSIPQTVEKLADAIPVRLHALVGHPYAYQTCAVLEFPLDSGRIALLERLRNGQGLSFRLEMEMTLNEMRAFEEAPPQMHRRYHALVDIHRLTLGRTLTVSQSKWIENVLPNVGGGKVHLLELPAAPLESVAVFKNSFDALKQGQEFHKRGLYDDAVGKCRLALDGFFEHVPETDGKGVTRQIPKLKKSWETRLGEATSKWLDTCLSSLKSPTNRPHHNPQAHFDQMESQMILAITTALVAYAARNFETPEPTSS